MGTWRPLSNGLVWFYALKITDFAHHLLEETGRILEQMEDEASAQKVRTILDTIDDQFHPCDTTLQIYDKLLSSGLWKDAN